MGNKPSAPAPQASVGTVQPPVAAVSASAVPAASSGSKKAAPGAPSPLEIEARLRELEGRRKMVQSKQKEQLKAAAEAKAKHDMSRFAMHFKRYKKINVSVKYAVHTCRPHQSVTISSHDLF